MLRICLKTIRVKLSILKISGEAPFKALGRANTQHDVEILNYVVYNENR